MFGPNFIVMLLMFGGGFINCMSTLYIYICIYTYIYIYPSLPSVLLVVARSCGSTIPVLIGENEACWTTKVSYGFEASKVATGGLSRLEVS